MKPTLKIFVAKNCPGCDEARVIAGRVEKNYPNINVELIDITSSQAAVPEAVFATPTFMLNNKIVSLGNPSPEQVAHWAEEAAAVQTEG